MLLSVYYTIPYINDMPIHHYLATSLYIHQEWPILDNSWALKYFIEPLFMISKGPGQPLVLKCTAMSH